MKSFILKTLSPGETGFKTSLSILVLRLAIGLTILFLQGIPKWNSSLGSMPNPLDLPDPFYAYFTLFSEILCAGLLVIGLGTRWALTILTITVGLVFFVDMGGSIDGNQTEFFQLISFLVIFICGPGSLSVDKAIHK
ncbi:MAG: DoxX family protein [Lentisphaeraceae bacterium]|nr:DoxX family protein [Lentisphaeraceae bacterium]